MRCVRVCVCACVRVYVCACVRVYVCASVVVAFVLGVDECGLFPLIPADTLREARAQPDPAMRQWYTPRCGWGSPHSLAILVVLASVAPWQPPSLRVAPAAVRGTAAPRDSEWVGHAPPRPDQRGLGLRSGYAARARWRPYRLISPRCAVAPLTPTPAHEENLRARIIHRLKSSKVSTLTCPLAGY